MSRTLNRVAWRHLLRHPWQSALMILGITLGVAVAVAIDLANSSASRAFDLSTESVTGKATHLIAGNPTGLDETLFAKLLRSGIPVPMAPVLTSYISSPQLGENLIQLLGVDAFAEASFRNYLATDESGLALSDLVAFLTRPGALLISDSLAQRYGLKQGDTLVIQSEGRQVQGFIAGLLQPSDSLSRRALDTLVLADIATAQEITGRNGKLDRIDLILPDPDPENYRQKIIDLLPRDARLMPVEARTGSIEQMTSAFRVNLTALSLLALVVGLFLIYNTMTFSVVQRRPLFGTLRCLGVTRGEIFWLVVGEAFIVGLIGAILGSALGVLMGQGAIRLVTQTINDLFFVVTVQGVQIPPSSLVKGILLGILATVFTAAPPAWEAATVQPRAALSRSGLEVKARKAVKFAALFGILFCLAGGLVLLLPTKNLVISFSGTFAIMTGFAMLAPLVTLLIARWFVPLAGKIWGSLGRMAPRNAINSLSRTSVAVAALMVAVSVTIGVSLMVSSFRYTVIIWLEQVLQGDIYITAPSLIATQSSAPIDPRVIEQVTGFPGVNTVLMLRSVDVDSPQGPVHIAASSNTHVAEERTFLSQDFTSIEINEKLAQGAVVVSEPFANRLKIPLHNGIIELYTDQGLHKFPVIGIYYDYASTRGTVQMSLDVYRKYWKDDSVTSIALRLDNGIDPDETSNQLLGQLSKIQFLQIRPNKSLRDEVLVVFDRTFAITGALQLLATIVAFVGVLSALLSLELERQREFGILRAIGLTARQLWSLVMIETGLLGFVAGLLALPTGYVLSLILIFIINKRSFGWTLQMHVLPEPFIQAIALAVAAALLAGIYPSYRMSKMLTVEAMRFD